MSVDSRLLADVSGAEGDALVAYLDTLGNWTIGRGHLLPKPAPGQSWEGYTISQAVSDRFLVEDLTSAVRYSLNLAEYPFCDTDCRQNALAELCFNMRSRWGHFHVTRDAITRQDWPAVQAGLLDSEWAAEVQPHEYTSTGTCKVCSQQKAFAGPKDYCKGRPGRATRIAGYFLTGLYP